nr:synaptobrevin, longin-like domain protein [Tanacetum cinerariifolium]
REFWSTARIETTNEGTKILATVDGKPRSISESLIRRNLKLNNEEGISSLPDAELFENLALMGYNILPNQKFIFQKGQFSHQWKFLIHAIMQCLSPKSTGFNEFSSNIASAVVCMATNRVYNFLKMIFDGMVRNVNDKGSKFLMYPRDDSQGEAFPTVSGLDAGQDRENIIKTSALPHDSTPRVTSLDADEGKEEAGVEKSTERGSNDTEELVNVLTFMEATNILTSGVQAVSVLPVAKVSTIGVPTVSGLVPTVSAIFTTASVIARDAEIARIHTEEELKMLIDSLDRNNEMIAKHLQEYEQSAAYLNIGEKIELINELVKYQDHHAKILKYQAQQSKPLSKKEQMELYMSVLRSHAGWKTKHFRGMTLEEIREKFIPVWKQIEDFVLMSSTEEAQRMKRKGLKLDEGSAKKMKISEDVSEKNLKWMMQLVPVEEVYVEALQVKHPIIDWEIHSKGKKDYWKIIRLGGHTAVY